MIVLILMGYSSAVAQQINTKIEITSTLNEGVKKQAKASMEGALRSFQMAYSNGTPPELDTSSFTPHGREAVLELWNRAPFRCIYTVLDGPLLRRSGDGLFEFRGVTLHLKDASGASFREEGLFIVDQEGRIADFKFGLDIQTYTQILEERKNVQEFRHRQVILDFVDNFRTAYNRKDISFLENVFSENALIIVGRVIRLKEEHVGDGQLLTGLGNERVEYIKHSKQEYLNRLHSVFQRNEFIKVEFDGINVYEHAEVPGIYGVELFQYWHSYSTRQAGYKDEGYLFLMIDLRNIDEPVIHVRTWQPKEETPREAVINLSNFRVID